MNKGDIFIQIASEVTGKSKEEAAEILKQFESSHPGQLGFDKEYSDEEAEKLLQELREEKEGIRAWFIEGGNRVAKNTGRA